MSVDKIYCLFLYSALRVVWIWFMDMNICFTWYLVSVTASCKWPKTLQ